MKTVNIFLISYHFTDLIFMVIDKINEVTKYPHRIIVVDNKSVNSPTIRKKLEEYMSLGKIHAAYFFNNNSRLNHCVAINNEEKADYTVWGDGDALIEDGLSECWLTEFLNMLESKPKLGIVAFSSKNAHYKLKGRRKVITDKKWKIFSCKERKGNSLPFNGHFMTLKTGLLMKLVKSRLATSGKRKNFGISDGDIQRYVARKRLLSARYDAYSVYNLSSVKLGYGIDGIEPSVDKIYKKQRPKWGRVRRRAGKFKRISK